MSIWKPTIKKQKIMASLKRSDKKKETIFEKKILNVKILKRLKSFVNLSKQLFINNFVTKQLLTICRLQLITWTETCVITRCACHHLFYTPFIIGFNYLKCIIYLMFFICAWKVGLLRGNVKAKMNQLQLFICKKNWDKYKSNFTKKNDKYFQILTTPYPIGSNTYNFKKSELVMI